MRLNANIAAIPSPHFGAGSSSSARSWSRTARTKPPTSATSQGTTEAQQEQPAAFDPAMPWRCPRNRHSSSSTSSATVRTPPSSRARPTSSQVYPNQQAQQETLASARSPSPHRSTHSRRPNAPFFCLKPWRVLIMPSPDSNFFPQMQVQIMRTLEFVPKWFSSKPHRIAPI